MSSKQIRRARAEELQLDVVRCLNSSVESLRRAADANKAKNTAGISLALHDAIIRLVECGDLLELDPPLMASVWRTIQKLDRLEANSKKD